MYLVAVELMPYEHWIDPQVANFILTFKTVIETLAISI